VINERELETDIEHMKRMIARDEFAEDILSMREEIANALGESGALADERDYLRELNAKVSRSRNIAWVLAGVCALAAVVMAMV